MSAVLSGDAAPAGTLPRAGGQMTGPIDFAGAVSTATTATVDLGTLGSNLVFLTGTSSVTSFGTAPAGEWRLVRFQSALAVLTNNANIVLPWGESRITKANDTFLVISEGSGVWRCLLAMSGDGSVIGPGPTWTHNIVLANGTDYDAVVTPGHYQITAGVHGPGGATQAFYLWVDTYDANQNYVVQRAADLDGTSAGKMFMRWRIAGVWGSWQELMVGALRSYLSGYNMTIPGGAKTLTIGPGTCTDDTNAVYIKSAANLNLNTAATGANGIDAGSPPNNGTLHIFAIAQAGGASPAAFASTSLTPALPGSYLYKRRIGSLTTDGSGNFNAVIQDGDEFSLVTPVVDLNATSPTVTTALTQALSVPTGVRLKAVLVIGVSHASAIVRYIVSDLSVADLAPASNNADIMNESIGNIGKTFKHVFTNTSAQVRTRADNATSLPFILTRGWIDRRGRDA